MKRWKGITINKTPMWVLLNTVTGQLDTDCGPIYAPTMYHTRAEAKTHNTSMRNGLGHRFAWRRVRLMEVK